MAQQSLTRRRILCTGLGLAAGLVAPAPLRAETVEDYRARSPLGPVTRNASAFVTRDWRDRFDSLGVATIVADTTSRARPFWDATGQDYRVYLTSVPISEALTRRGHTEIVRKRIGPDWTPTPSMIERNPELR